MGACSTKEVVRPFEIPSKVQVVSPITSESANIVQFPSLNSSPNKLFSSAFLAFGCVPSASEGSFSLKPIKFRISPPSDIFSSNKLSVISRKGVKDQVNQDNFFIRSSDLYSAFGVFDGHGDNGHIVSSIARKSLAKHLNTLGLCDLKQVFSRTEEEIIEKSLSKSCDCSFSGCTATLIAVMYNVMTVAHLGDSMAIVLKRYQNKLISVPLTIDHKPAHIIEKERIEKAGGKIRKQSKFDLERVYVPGQRLGLSVTRAFGDTAFKNFGVVHHPFVRKVKIEANDEFLVVASDGLWDMVDLCEVSEAFEKFDCRNACDFLVELAHKRWVEGDENESDDITILAVGLSN